MSYSITVNGKKQGGDPPAPDFAGYIRRLIERHVRGLGTLSELLAPTRREFADSGLSEDELDSLVEEARAEAWREFAPVEDQPER